MSNVVAFDIETTGLNPREGSIVSMQCLFDENHGLATDRWACVDKKNPMYSGIWESIVHEVLGNPSYKKIMHNAYFECSWIWEKYGVEIVNFEDTMLLPFVADQGVPFVYTGDSQKDNREKLHSVALKSLVHYYFKEDVTEADLFNALGTRASKGIVRTIAALFIDTETPLSILFKGKGPVLKQYGIETRAQLYEYFKSYAVKDVQFTRKLWEKFEYLSGIESYKIEKRLIPALLKIEQRGIKIDREYFHELGGKYLEEINRVTKRLGELSGDAAFNPGQKAKVAELLMSRGAALPQTKKGTGYQVNKKALATITDPITELINTYGQMTAFKANHIDGILRVTDEHGVLHPHYLSSGTVHGRFSSQNPNMQNLPAKDIRRGFIARDGYVFVFFDYSQIELRVGAYYLQDRPWQEEYNKSNPDIHWRTVCELIGPDSPKEYRKTFGKAFNFGIMYGAGVQKIATLLAEAKGGTPDQYIGPAFLNHLEYLKITHKWISPRSFGSDVGEAYLIKERFERAHPSFKQFKMDVKDRLMGRGYIQNAYGRRYTLPERVRYKALEYLTSGHATGDLIKEKMCEVSAYLEQEDAGAIVATIHDELICEIKTSRFDAVAEIKRIMEDVPKLKGILPILVDVKYGLNWEDKHEHPLGFTQ